jgi:RNA recognition motif-containing protein
MLITLFVGNFPYETQPSELMNVFSRFGRVESIKLISEHVTGRARGFGFVKIEKSAGLTAIEALHRSDFKGRPLNVREAGPVRRDITVADSREGAANFSPSMKSEMFVQDYWLNQSQINSRRQNQSNNYR